MRHALIRTRLRVPDLDASVDHLVAVLGLSEVWRDEAAAGLGLPGQPACVELVTGSAAIVSMTLATDASTLAEVASRAAAHGDALLERQADRLSLMAPHGVVVHVVVGAPGPPNDAPRDAGPVVGSLDHLSFTAGDLRRSVEFFCDVLGFRVSDRVAETRYWLRCNENHHTVALFAGDDGLQHYAFETRDANELVRLGDALGDRGRNLLWGIGRHGLGENVFTYHLDPAGAVLEVCSDMVQIPDEDAWTVGVWDEDTTASAIRWGQLPPPGFRDTTIPSARGATRA
jgi:catechol 2,3-dioxygenase-like lactoylglutathione lyase family enzyme